MPGNSIRRCEFHSSAAAVSALAQTGAELGGALGIAVLGSLGTAIYRGMVASALPEGNIARVRR
ncbi:MAG: hypothetical protein E6I75_25860, partial [Chloroflexi bacterium]